MKIPLHDFLSEMIQSRGSDLLLASGFPPAIRVYGRLESTAMPPLQNRDVVDLLQEIVLPQEYDRIRDQMNLDFAYEGSIPGVGRCRFRCNAYIQRNGMSVVFRMIPWEAPSLLDLGLPEVFSTLTRHRNGLVLVTGPTGSGKTSTLAAMCRHINETRPVHVITIEDPIEYVHRDDRAIIVQRQVGVHVESFQRALRAALREDPDVIVVGEMRDLETMQLAITAAETGHLVMATLHTVSASQTISRIVSSFPSGQQWQVRAMMADSLRAVISQQLLPKMGGAGRIPAVELLLNSEAVANLIREDKLFQIPGVVESSASKGMHLMDQDLIRLVSEGLVEPTEALDRAHDKLDFSTRVEFRKKV